MEQSVIPRLTLIGAGPGDPDLITVKALKKLAEADVVLFDALINTELLKYAPTNAERIFVGKRSGIHRFTQEKINDMIVQYARKRGHVVRLKGGDPFVFGRGFEEYAVAVNHQIPVEVVPGISSPTGVTAMQHLPVTLRGISESFWVVTGNTRHGVFSSDVGIAAQSTATVIILMGMNKLSEIVKVYRQIGKEDYGVMVIQNGTIAGEKQVTGKIKTIEVLVEQHQLTSPAIIVVGRIVDQTRSCILENKKALRSQEQDINTSMTKKPKGDFSKVIIDT